MKKHAVPPHACPSCSKLLRVQNGLTSQAAPKPGDFTVCDGCGQLLRFTEGLGIRKAGDHEVNLLSADFRAMLLTLHAHYKQGKPDEKNRKKN